MHERHVELHAEIIHPGRIARVAILKGAHLVPREYSVLQEDAIQGRARRAIRTQQSLKIVAIEKLCLVRRLQQFAHSLLIAVQMRAHREHEEFQRQLFDVVVGSPLKCGDHVRLDAKHPANFDHGELAQLQELRIVGRHQPGFDLHAALEQHRLAQVLRAGVHFDQLCVR